MKINHEGIKITQTVQLSALFLLLQPDDPAEWIFFPAVLDVRQVIEQIKRHFTDLVVVDDVINAVDVQLADRCDDCRCPCTEDFRDSRSEERRVVNSSGEECHEDRLKYRRKL